MNIRGDGHTFRVVFKWIFSSVLAVYIYHDESVQTSKTTETTTGTGA